MKKGAVVPTSLRTTPVWFSTGANTDLLSEMGAKLDGGGPHQSKTMMLTDLATVLAAGAEARAELAIIDENLLGKPSTRARGAAAYRLRQLYGVSDPAPSVCRALFALWRRDVAGRPMLALLCALARDPSFRGGAAAVLDAKVCRRHPLSFILLPRIVNAASSLTSGWIFRQSSPRWSAPGHPSPHASCWHLVKLSTPLPPTFATVAVQALVRRTYRHSRPRWMKRMHAIFFTAPYQPQMRAFTVPLRKCPRLLGRWRSTKRWTMP